MSAFAKLLLSVRLSSRRSLVEVWTESNHASNKDFILHPKLIIEVLFDSTEAFDRGDKLADYKSIPELEEYILIDQKQVLVEQFLRKFDAFWMPHLVQAGDQIEFVSIGYTCPFLYSKN
jgi:Uma2 family endonuclease